MAADCMPLLLSLLIGLAALGTTRGQPGIDGSGTVDLQSPVGRPSIRLVGLWNWGAASLGAGPGCPPFAPPSSDRLRKAKGYQQTLALAIDASCKIPFLINGEKFDSCDAFLNYGDAFLDCEMDNSSRFNSDWAAVYRSQKSTPLIDRLPWYGIFGDRDTISTNAGAPSIDVMRGYTQENPEAWITPFRYWSASQELFVLTGREIAYNILYLSINTSPFVTEYSDPTSPYYNHEINITSTPASISAQLDYIESKLSSTPTPDWIFVTGHHSLVGAAKQQRGLPSTVDLGPGGTNDLGMPDLNGRPAFQRLFDMIRKYKVDLYMSGHDEALSLAVDPEDPLTYQTLFMNSGAGSYPSLKDSCGYTRDYVTYVNADRLRGDCSKGVTGHAHLGFTQLSLDGFGTGSHVELWTLPDNSLPSAFLAHSADIPFKRVQNPVG